VRRSREIPPVGLGGKASVCILDCKDRKNMSSRDKLKRSLFILLFGALFGVGCLIMLLFSSQGICDASDPLSISEVLARVQERYETTDFEADFEQESHLKAIGVVDSAQGHVYFRPPAMMRWHYKTPEEYLIITDGKRVWIYRPEENQVMTGGAADYFGDIKWAEFFSQPERILDHFSVGFADPARREKDRLALQLFPKKRQPNLEEMLLFISQDTFDIVETVTCNAFGDKTSIRFKDFQFNQGLDPSFFMFKVPKGADVLQLEGE
jgi:outer membrane lipoprotein carrier protein